ncbi:hypothetical protein Tco_0929178 [Tanacetum coccineum]
MDRLEWSRLELRLQEASDDRPLESQNTHQTSVETAAPNLYWWGYIPELIGPGVKKLGAGPELECTGAICSVSSSNVT